MSNEDQINQLRLLLKQEEGKNIALSRENSEIKRRSKIIEDQANALKTETDASLIEAAQQMQVALAVSQGVWALAHLARSFLARKVAAARVVHREQQILLLTERIMNAIGKDPEGLKTAVDQAKNVIETIRSDGEATRVQVAETVLSTGLDDFLAIYDSLVAKRNDFVKGPSDEI